DAGAINPAAAPAATVKASAAAPPAPAAPSGAGRAASPLPGVAAAPPDAAASTPADAAAAAEAGTEAKTEAKTEATADGSALHPATGPAIAGTGDGGDVSEPTGCRFLRVYVDGEGEVWTRVGPWNDLARTAAGTEAEPAAELAARTIVEVRPDALSCQAALLEATRALAAAKVRALAVDVDAALAVAGLTQHACAIIAAGGCYLRLLAASATVSDIADEPLLPLNGGQFDPSGRWGISGSGGSSSSHENGSTAFGGMADGKPKRPPAKAAAATAARSPTALRWPAFADVSVDVRKGRFVVRGCNHYAPATKGALAVLQETFNLAPLEVAVEAAGGIAFLGDSFATSRRRRQHAALRESVRLLLLEETEALLRSRFGLTPQRRWQAVLGRGGGSTGAAGSDGGGACTYVSIFECYERAEAARSPGAQAAAGAAASDALPSGGLASESAAKSSPPLQGQRAAPPPSADDTTSSGRETAATAAAGSAGFHWTTLAAGTASAAVAGSEQLRFIVEIGVSEDLGLRSTLLVTSEPEASASIRPAVVGWRRIDVGEFCATVGRSPPVAMAATAAGAAAAAGGAAVSAAGMSAMELEEGIAAALVAGEKRRLNGDVARPIFGGPALNGTANREFPWADECFQEPNGANLEPGAKRLRQEASSPPLAHNGRGPRFATVVPASGGGGGGSGVGDGSMGAPVTAEALNLILDAANKLVLYARLARAFQHGCDVRGTGGEGSRLVSPVPPKAEYSYALPEWVAATVPAAWRATPLCATAVATRHAAGAGLGGRHRGEAWDWRIALSSSSGLGAMLWCPAAVQRAVAAAADVYGNGTGQRAALWSALRTMRLSAPGANGTRELRLTLAPPATLAGAATWLTEGLAAAAAGMAPLVAQALALVAAGPAVPAMPAPEEAAGRFFVAAAGPLYVLLIYRTYKPAGYGDGTAVILTDAVAVVRGQSSRTAPVGMPVPPPSAAAVGASTAEGSAAPTAEAIESTAASLMSAAVTAAKAGMANAAAAHNGTDAAAAAVVAAAAAVAADAPAAAVVPKGSAPTPDVLAVAGEMVGAKDT
ncbi:unnamed protein product, partial [Phaeothamnion confervicola]